VLIPYLPCIRDPPPDADRRLLYALSGRERLEIHSDLREKDEGRNGFLCNLQIRVRVPLARTIFPFPI
jgi:hypothetical protein